MSKSLSNTERSTIKELISTAQKLTKDEQEKLLYVGQGMILGSQLKNGQQS